MAQFGSKAGSLCFQGSNELRGAGVAFSTREVSRVVSSERESPQPDSERAL